MKLNSTNRNTLKAIAVVFLLLCVLMMMRPRRSMYQPRPVNLETSEEAGPTSIFDPVSYTHLTLPTICSV